jgi:hypothetical protein
MFVAQPQPPSCLRMVPMCGLSHVSVKPQEGHMAIVVRMTCPECDSPLARRCPEVVLRMADKHILVWCDSGHRIEAEAGEHIEALVSGGVRIIHEAVQFSDSVIDRTVGRFSRVLNDTENLGDFIEQVIGEDAALLHLNRNVMDQIHQLVSSEQQDIQQGYDREDYAQDEYDEPDEERFEQP